MYLLSLEDHARNRTAATKHFIIRMGCHDQNG